MGEKRATYKYTYEEAMAITGSASFERMGDIDRKLATLQAIERRMAAEQGREARRVEAVETDRLTRGWYDHATRTIGVNRGLLVNAYGTHVGGLVGTIVHEGAHALQHDVAEGRVQWHNPSEARVWAENLRPGNYVRAEKDFLGYTAQPVEQAARAYSDGRCRAMAYEREAALEALTARGVSLEELECRPALNAANELEKQRSHEARQTVDTARAANRTLDRNRDKGVTRW